MQRDQGSSVAPARLTATRLGRVFFGLAVLASGVQQVVLGDFVRLVPKVESGFPWPSLLARPAGLALIAIGLAVLVGWQGRRAALLLAAMLLVSFFLLQLPRAAKDPLTGFLWTNPLKGLALVGGCLVLARTFSAGASGGPSEGGVLRRQAIPWSRALLGLFLVVCGLQHFVYNDFVARMVPAWIPHPTFWACFTGVALIAGGVGIVGPATRRWAALATGGMLLSWVVLLHIPRALADPGNAGETSGIFEALALSGVAFLLAANGRRTGTSEASGDAA